MLVCVLVGCCLLGYCFGLTKLNRWAIETTPVLVISMIISILFFCGYYGVIRYAAYLTLGLGALLFVTTPLYIRSSGGGLAQQYFTPGFVFWLLLVIAFAVFAAIGWPHNYDDFSFWMPHAKILYLHERFQISTDHSANKSYPPAAPLFYYLFVLFGNYSNAVVRVAQTVLVLSPLLMLFSFSKWQHWKTVLWSMVAIVIFMFLACNVALGFDVRLDPDIVAGLLFGAMLLFYWVSKKTSN